MKHLASPVIQTIKKLIYPRFCPVCENPSRQFKAFGIVPRKDAECPHCGALERHRLVWLYLKRCGFFRTKQNRFLHIAPEFIFSKFFRQQFGSSYITADLLDPKVDLNFDITDIPFPEATISTIFCSHVLEHVEDDYQAIQEFYRILERGGTAYIMVPITSDETFEDPSIVDPVEREKAFGQSDHVRRYGPDFVDRLKCTNWHVQHVKPEDFLTRQEITRMGITQDAGDVFVCKK